MCFPDVSSVTYSQ